VLFIFKKLLKQHTPLTFFCKIIFISFQVLFYFFCPFRSYTKTPATTKISKNKDTQEMNFVMRQMRHKATYQELPRMGHKDEHGHGDTKGDTKRGCRSSAAPKGCLHLREYIYTFII